MSNAEDRITDLLLRYEAVEDFKQSVDDSLAERVGGFSDLAVIVPAGRQSKIAALVGYDRGGTVDRPPGDFGSGFDRDGLHHLSLCGARGCIGCEVELCPLLNTSVHEAGPRRAVEKIRHGRRRPFRPAVWRLLMEPFELSGDLANCEFLIDEWMPAMNVIKRSSGGRTGEFLSSAGSARVLLDHQFHRATEPLSYPVASSLLQHASDLVPDMIWPHTLHRRKPLVERHLDTFSVGLLLGRGHLRKHRGLAFTYAGVARSLAL